MRPIRIRTRDFYESRIWKFHQVANLYERIRLQNIFEFLTPKYVDIILDAGCGGGLIRDILLKPLLLSP